MAAIASTMGTARGNTQGSWRPRAFRVVSTPSMFTVCCSMSTVATGLKAHAEVDVLSVADASLYASRVVGVCHDASAVVVEHIVLFRAFLFQPLETVSVLEGLGCVDAQHARGQCRLQFAKHGLSQADGAALDDAGHHASYGVAFGLHLFDVGGHLLCLLRVGAAHGVVLHQAEVVGRCSSLPAVWDLPARCRR